MKKLLITLFMLSLAACASHHEALAPTIQPTEKKGGFQVEHHETPISTLDSIQTLDNVHLFAKNVYFKPGSAKITPEGRKILNGLMGMMQLEPAYAIHIVGLADETENKPKALSMKRALSVAQLLRSNGIAERRIRINGQGQDLNLGCKKLPKGDREKCLSAERMVVLTNKY